MLSIVQEQDAIYYNQRRGYSDLDIKFIQRTVGAKCDGKLGPDTVNKVAAWQTMQGLKVDGKVGPSTWTEMRRLDELEATATQDKSTPEVGCGLAAYDQQFPGHTAEEALQVAWNTSLALGCKEIRFWSTEWLIDDSLPYGGNKGNKYSGPWLAKQKVPDGVIVGAWVDDPIHDACKPEYADKLVEMHISRAALMINRSNTRPSNVPWALRWERPELEAIAKVYEMRGIECLATCWPQPSKSQIDAMCEDLAWILKVLKSNVLEMDTEGNWTAKFLSGFKNMAEASKYLADKMRELVGPDGKCELTTYTYHPENSKNASLAPLMDNLLPQAYSVRHRGNDSIGFSDLLGPGKHQTLAINRAIQAATAGK